MSLQGWQADLLRQALGLSSAHCATSAAVKRASYMSLQGWEADVLRQALGLSSAHCASSEGCACDRASIYTSLQGW